MARIPTYTPQVEATGQIGGRAPTANDFGSNAAGYLGAGMSDAGDTLYKVAATNEVASVNTQLAQFRASQTVKLKQMATDAPAGDPNFASNFATQMNDELSKMGGNVSTREGQLAFQRGAGETTAALTQAAGSYQIQSAGVKAQQDYIQFTDALGHTARTDPLQGASLIATATAAMNDPNGPYARMPADQRAVLLRQTQENLARASFEGLIAKDPAYAKQQLDNGPLSSFLHGESERVLNSEIRSAQMAQDARATRVMAQQEHDLRIRSETAASTIIGQMIQSAAPGSTVKMPDPVADIANNPAFAHDPTRKEALYKLVVAGSKEMLSHDEKTYGAGFYDLFTKVTSGQVRDSQALYGHVGPYAQDELGNQIDGPNDLTIAGLEKLQHEMTGRNTPEGLAESEMKKAVMKTAYDALTGSDPLLHIKDPNGDTQNLKFMAQFLPAWEAGKAAGLTPAQMSDPDSPNYLGKIANQFKRTRAQQIADLMSANQGNPNLPAVTGGGGTAAAPIDAVKAIPGVQYSAKRKQYRDPATGKVYDENGAEVK